MSDKNLTGAPGDVSLSAEFIENYVRFISPQYIQVYLYAAHLYEKNGTMPSAEQIAGELSVAPDRVSFILGYWVSRGELLRDENGEYSFPENGKAAAKRSRKRSSANSRPSYKSGEIDAASEKNSVLSGMFYQAESILGHMLSGSEMELLYSFYDWLGLPCEVIVMLLSYAAKMGKTGKRYLETVAIDWADKGIDTFDKAEEYISRLEEIHSNEHKMRSILGIYDRALTQTEKKYIKAWTEEMNISPELVELAYDRTIQNTGKLSWAYMNKILKSWHDSGIKDVEGVKREDVIHGGKAAAKKPADNKKSKFYNYTDTEDVDYAELEEKLLDMILDN